MSTSSVQTSPTSHFAFINISSCVGKGILRVFAKYTLPYSTPAAGETAALKGCSAGKPQCFTSDIPASVSCKAIQLCKFNMLEKSHHHQRGLRGMPYV